MNHDKKLIWFILEIPFFCTETMKRLTPHRLHTGILVNAVLLTYSLDFNLNNSYMNKVRAMSANLNYLQPTIRHNLNHMSSIELAEAVNWR